MNINELVESAKSGDSKALEKIILEIQDKVYGLSLKMLYDPIDASDATQEILIKVITNLSSFRGESLFTTWVYRIAVNYLLRTKNNKSELTALSFEEYKDDLDLENSELWQEEIHDDLDKIFLDEIRISCLQGLLLCLSRDLRIVFLLVDVFDFNSTEGAEILEISPEAFRKRLSRAREKLQNFLFKNCNLANKSNKCKCGYHVTSQINGDRFSEENIRFGNLRVKNEFNYKDEKIVREMDELNHLGYLYKMSPDVKTPEKLFENIRQVLNSEKYIFLKN
jgi:RNA polymerase sigma factor (sigma-70 family)